MTARITAASPELKTQKTKAVYERVDEGPELDTMTVAELKNLAKKKNVSLTGITKKADIIQALSSKSKAKKEESEPSSASSEEEEKPKKSAKGKPAKVSSESSSTAPELVELPTPIEEKKPSILKTFIFVLANCSLRAFGENHFVSYEKGRVIAFDPHTAAMIFFNSIVRFLENKLVGLARKKVNKEHYKQHPFQKFVIKSKLTVTLDQKTYRYTCSKVRTFVTSEEFTIIREASEDIEQLAAQRGIPLRTLSFTQNVCDMYDLLSESQVDEENIKYVLGCESDRSLKEIVTSRFSSDDGEEGDTLITKYFYEKRRDQVIRARLREKLLKVEEENEKLKDSVQEAEGSNAALKEKIRSQKRLREKLLKVEEENEKLKESFRETEESNEALKEKIRAQEETIIHLQTESALLNIQNSVIVSSRISSSYMDELSILKGTI